MARRVLRDYQGIANKRYTCMHCDIPIMPGDWYFARVIVYDRPHRFYVEKFHCGCPEEPDERQRECLDDGLVEEICERIAA